LAEFVNDPVQLVALNTPAVLYDSIRCPKGYVLHRNGSGIVTLRGIVNNPCACSARYQVNANGNIAVPTGGTAGAIAVALTIDGEPIRTSRAIVTPPAAEEYFNVTSTAIIDVSRGCCVTISLDPVAATDDVTVTPVPFINIQNLNITVNRIA
jgi:hypothetical protein